MTIFERYPSNRFLNDLKSNPRCNIFALPERIDALYQHIAGQEDPHFDSELDRQPQARIWEMMVAKLIHDCGWQFQNSGTGPDFIVTTPTGRICIEAICVTDGAANNKDRVPPLKNGVAEEVPNRELLLRVTSALATKAGKLRNDITANYARGNDALIVAISASNMLRAQGCHPPLGIQATLGVGNLYAIVNANKPGIERTGYARAPAVRKTEGREITCTPFDDGLMNHISGVIYSEASMFSADFDLHRDSLFIHNHKADNPLPSGVFKGIIAEHNHSSSGPRKTPVIPD